MEDDHGSGRSTGSFATFSFLDADAGSLDRLRTETLPVFTYTAISHVVSPCLFFCQLCRSSRFGFGCGLGALQTNNHVSQ